MGESAGTTPDDVAAVSPSDVWMVSQKVHHWDGTAWSEVPSPNPNYLWGVAAISADDAWAVGSSADYLHTYTQHWDGATWTPVPSPSPPRATSLLRRVEVISTHDVWAVGGYSNGTGDKALIEHWNGSRWAVVPSPSPGRSGFSDVDAVTPHDAWAVGSSDSNPLVAHWDGAVWSEVATPDVGGGSLDAVAAIAADDVWAVGYGNGNLTALIEHWDGDAWTAVDGPVEDTGLAGIAAVSSGDVWAVSWQTADSLVEHFDGTSWTEVSVPASFRGSYVRVSGVGALPSGQVWISGYSASTQGAVAERLCEVQVKDGLFFPQSSTVTIGNSVYWTMPSANQASHTVTDASGMGLFDSGLKPPASSYAFSFIGAGTYPVVDGSTGATSAIHVPMRLAPVGGGLTTVFTIRWAATTAPAGFEFDVQIKRPGSSSFVEWLTGETADSESFIADAGIGTYTFQARLRNIGNGATSDWSPPGSIVVS